MTRSAAIAGAGRALVIVSSGLVAILASVSALLLMVAMNLGAHGPTFVEFLAQVWQLPAALLLSAAAMWAGFRVGAGEGALVLLLSAALLGSFWWPILS